jgi:transposase
VRWRISWGCSQTTVSLWRQRFLEDRLEGLYGRHRGTRATASSQKLETRILALTQKPPPEGSTHWTTRKLGRALDVSHMRVARVWSRASLRPLRVEHYVASNDADFETKAADVIALYVNPPQHAVVFSVDEKTAIQALDRTLPTLPFSPGRAERHGFEYIRRGTLSLYAALNTRTGEVIGKTVTSHTSEEFVAFLASVVASWPAKEEIHVILDNLSAHKTKRVGEFLSLHQNVHLHFTPTYSSWLNQAEIWLSKIERDVIARGIFKSAPDLSRKLMRYIQEHNKTAKPIKWKYVDVTRRIHAPHSTVTVH